VLPLIDPVTGPAATAPAGTVTDAAVHAALTRVIDPEIRKPITDLDMVSGVRVDSEGLVTVGIRLTIAGCPAAARIESDVLAAAESVAGPGRATVDVAIMTREQRTALTEKLRGGRAEPVLQFGPDTLTRIYAITSGKGGVGKSTVTANLAVALAGRGLRVGIIDADVYGFSVAWRGPMLHRTISQFLTDVFFGDLDVLLLDLPPGTGDVAITVGQLLPHSEVIVVTTPQPAAADVAERSGIVARQTGQSVYGVIETMSGMTQPDGSVLNLFGEGGGTEVARRLSAGQDSTVPLLAQIPLSVALRDGGDVGVPIVVSDPQDPAAVAIQAVAARLATRARGLSGLSLVITPR